MPSRFEFEWIDDFGAARRYADSLCRGGFLAWADGDDRIVGADRLRQLAAGAPPHVVAFVFGYDYARDPVGNSISYLRRERLVRAGAGRWENRVHEAQALDGQAVDVPAEVCEWVHDKPLRDDELEAGRSKSNERNLRILHKWAEDEPRNPRVLAYTGTETAISGDHPEALRWYKRYLDLDPGWDEERAQVHRKAAMSLMALGRYKEARQTSLVALDVMPGWPDSYLSLAECCLAMGEPGKAVEWADEVLRRGPPRTLLIVNSLDYRFQPLLVKAGALADLGDVDGAVELGRRALEVAPWHGELRASWERWRRSAKRDHTARTWTSAARLLVEHDEQLKARTVLETVPHYAADHPLVVQERVRLRRRLRWLEDGYEAHYGDASHPTEDFHRDEEVDPVCGEMHRTGWLADRIRELEAA